MTRADNCVEGLHWHVGICQRAGYANGVLDGRADLAAGRESAVAEALQEAWGCGPGEYIMGDLSDPDTGDAMPAPVGQMCASQHHGHAHWLRSCEFADKSAAAVLAALDTPPALGDDERSTLTVEVIAALWREHSNCSWVSTGANVMWSCGIWHPGPIHMQPTTRDRHFAELVMTQVKAEAVAALACCEHCEGAPTTRCWVADSIDGHAEPCSECADLRAALTPDQDTDSPEPPC